MKRVKINSLLDLPLDGVTYQTEWTGHSRQGKRSMLLEIALLAGNFGPGLFIISYFTKWDVGLLLGFLIVAIGYGIPHLVFLGKIGRFWRAILKPRSSWISKGFIFASMFMLFGFLAVADQLPIAADLFAFVVPYIDYILILAVISALLLAIYPGFLFAVIRAIPFWNSGAVVPLFLFQAIGAGIGLTFIFSEFTTMTLTNPDLLVPLNIVMIALIGIAIGIIIKSGKAKSGSAGTASVKQLVHGKFRFLFIIGAVVIGILVPMIIMVMSYIFIDQSILLAIAGVMQIIGIISFKYTFLNAGAYNRLFTLRSMSHNPKV